MITIVPEGKTATSNTIRIHSPMPLSNPFKIDYRLDANDCAVAYKAWLQHRINKGDKLIIAELDRIAQLDDEGEAILIGSKIDGEVIIQLISEAKNEQ